MNPPLRDKAARQWTLSILRRYAGQIPQKAGTGARAPLVIAKSCERPREENLRVSEKIAWASGNSFGKMQPSSFVLSLCILPNRAKPGINISTRR